MLPERCWQMLVQRRFQHDGGNQVETEKIHSADTAMIAVPRAYAARVWDEGVQQTLRFLEGSRDHRDRGPDHALDHVHTPPGKGLTSSKILQLGAIRGNRNPTREPFTHTHTPMPSQPGSEAAVVKLKASGSRTPQSPLSGISHHPISASSYASLLQAEV